MIALLQIIAPVAGLRAAATISRPVFQAANRVDLSLKLGLASTLILALSLVLAGRWGLTGFAVAYAFNSLFALVTLGVSARLVNIDKRELAAMLVPPLVAALCMFAVVTAVRWFMVDASSGLDSSHGVFTRFVILVTVGALTYGLGILLIARAHCGDVRNVISRFRAK